MTNEKEKFMGEREDVFEGFSLEGFFKGCLRKSFF